MTKAVRLPTASAAALVLCLLGLASAVSADNNNKRNDLQNQVVGEAEKRNLFHDDENFWSRFVQEVTSSSITPPPSPGPTPEPSAAPTEFCETEVRI